jgi:hypothetical protein
MCGCFFTERNLKGLSLSNLIVRPGLQVSAGAVVLTDAVFWGLIVPFTLSAHFSLNAVSGSHH